MKLFGKFAVLCLTLITINVTAQKKSESPINVILDCAKSNNSISVSEMANCKKLVLLGQGSENFKIIAGIVSMKLNGNLKEWILKDNSFSEELMAAIKQLAAGDKMHIENIKIQSIKDGKIIKNIPTATLVVK